jgi:hypothetical protein
MKKAIAIIIAVMLLAAVVPAASAASTVYVSVSVDGKLELAAQPVTVTDMTVNGAIKAAHDTYYSGGGSGYAAGVDQMWNMFMITKCWGISTTPYVILNDVPVGSKASPASADTSPVKAGDNIVIAMSSDPVKPAVAVAMTASVSGSSATITATSWSLDFTTFTYDTKPLSGASVVDDTGASLGTTDAGGSATVTIPVSGIIAIKGLSAIHIGASAAAPAAAATAATATAAGTTPAPAAGTAPAAPDAAVAADSSAAAPVAAAPANSGTMVYFTVSVDGSLLVAAEPVYVTDLTVEAVLRAAHAAFYAGGESGFSAGVDKTWNMYMITKCWGIMTTPYIIVNDAPMGSKDFATADTAKVKQGDNVILSLSSDFMKPAKSISLTIDALDDSTASLTVTTWDLDFEIFAYEDSPMAGAKVIDPATGAELGSTDVNGKITVNVPESGVAAVDGLSAIRVDGTAAEPTQASGGFGGGFGDFDWSSWDTGAGGFGGGFGSAKVTPVDNKPIAMGVIGVCVLAPVLAAIVLSIVKQIRKSKAENPEGY